jgi:hypothetical protein
VLQTAATDVPRFDHDPTTGESLGLLVEEQRTNSIRNNTMVGAVAGTPGTLPTNFSVSGFSGLTREVVATGTSNGVNYVDVRHSGTSTGSFGNLTLDVATGTSASNNQTWASSVWLQIVAGSTSGLNSVTLSVQQRDAGNVYLSDTSNAALSGSVGNTFQRLSRVHTTTNASIAFIQPYLQFGLNIGAAIDFTIRIGLPQLEQGATVSSVIPTTTAAVTRSADVVSITGSAFSSWYRQDEGTVFMEANTFSVATIAPTWWRVSDGTSANFIRLIRSGVGATPQMQITSGGAGQGSPFTPGISANTFFKNACYYKTDDFGVTTNGSALTGNAIDTLATMPTGIDRLELSTAIVNGYYKRMTFWPQRLANSTLQQLTQ